MNIAEAMRIQRWFNSTLCIRWIGRHKSTSLLGTELVNYGTHGLDPLGVSFSLGGTLVNVLFISLLLPCLETPKTTGHGRDVPPLLWADGWEKAGNADYYVFVLRK